jgi:hypothetical protein
MTSVGTHVRALASAKSSLPRLRGEYFRQYPSRHVLRPAISATQEGRSSRRIAILRFEPVRGRADSECTRFDLTEEADRSTPSRGLRKSICNA